MKKSRILLALTDKLECLQNKAKIKRIQKCIEVATINAEEKMARADDTLNSIVKDFTVDSDVQEFITGISKVLCEKDDAKAEIDQLKRVEQFLFEELEEPKEEK